MPGQLTFTDCFEQSSLDSFLENACPVCHRVQENVPEHLLTDHPDTVNARLEEMAATHDPVPDNGHDDPITTPEPTMYAQIEVDTPGHRFRDVPDHRACNDCGARMSIEYARIFANELGDLYCPDCRSRSERYSNEGGAFGGTSPASVTGQSNPNAR